MNDMTSKLFLIAACIFFVSTAVARRLSVSAAVPEFSVVDEKGVSFSYPGEPNEVLLVAFLSPSKSNSVKGLSDLEKILDTIDKSANRLSVLIVLDDPNAVSALDSKQVRPDSSVQKHIVVDRDYKLWGTFGVIASPSVFLAGVDHKIMLIKAGYGYDFAPAIKSKLLLALGLKSEDTFDSSKGVKTAKNTSASGKVARHLKMAAMLEQKQKYDSAVAQLELAVGIDPNSTESRLELGRLYCLTNQPKKAIDSVQNLKPTLQKDIGRLQFVTGWASRIEGDLPAAKEALSKATAADPASVQTLFQLGQVYEATGQTDLALKAYKQALSILLGAK